jgi:hypothetical protein
LLLLALVLAAVAAGGLVAAGPWFEAEGIKLPWAAPPRAPYVALTAPSTVQQGGLWGITVSPFYDRPLSGVRGNISGLPAVSEVAFYEVAGRFVAMLAVSYSAQPGQYLLKLRILDHKQREHLVDLPLTVESRGFPEQKLKASPSQTSLLASDKLAEDRAKINAARANPSPWPLWEGPFVQPVQGRVTTEFGVFRTINGVITGRHSGIDWAAPEGTPVVAAAGGRVTFTGSLWVSGDTVILDHGLGLFSAYNHLSRIAVREGQVVAAGEVVGEVGMTGFSTGNHLHFTLWHGSVPTNPWPWFEQDPRLLLR